LKIGSIKQTIIFEEEKMEQEKDNQAAAIARGLPGCLVESAQ
jgi:hypothetical protein